MLSQPRASRVEGAAEFSSLRDKARVMEMSLSLDRVGEDLDESSADDVESHGEWEATHWARQARARSHTP